MAKTVIPAPIDRPLAKAYLREFSGWSTAYPPGLSDPTSLRTRENLYITREGAARIRPGIRSVFTDNWWLGNSGEQIVGAFEHFVYDNTSRVALLFATKQAGGLVGFRVVLYNESTDRFDDQPGVFPALTFSAETTYVKYLQIDNKILALSNDPLEPGILFNVGEIKSAKKVPAEGLVIPAPTDVPVVVHPDAAWINNPVKATRPVAETPNRDTLISSLPTIGVVTINSPAVPGIINAYKHGLRANEPLSLTTTGTLPGGLVPQTVFYVAFARTRDSIDFSATPGGAKINTTGTGQSGVHTLSQGTRPDGTVPKSVNTYSFGYFYTFETEFGESAPSGIQTIKAARGWSQWRFLEPDADGFETQTTVVEPEMAMDQFVGMLPPGQYLEAKIAGAVKWNLYQFSWNETSPVPSIATLVGSRAITQAGTEETESWIQNTAAALAESYVVPIPNDENRVNYSGGPTARQGLSAGDRLILVNDGANQALIRWSANVPKEYINFSPSKGGGTKVLSSGNLLVPQNVALWQNPQAQDTLTITCRGLNGYHAAFYMSPARVEGQSEQTLIMGFEETTATPGTVSPYGVEVLKNKLYHPLEAELMASTAANYSISHKTTTTDIANKWQRLASKENIVSSQHDSRLYYIVHNPEGEPLEDGCMGNEVWVLDVATDTAAWSRWLVQGIALRKLQIGDKLYMAIVKPDAIFIFDELAYQDEYADGAGTLLRNISWKLETNTLGANRAHDMWAHVYQAQIHAGDWLGSFEWGVRGYDVNGRLIEKKKISHTPQNDDGVVLADGGVTGGVDLGDATDFMQIQRDLMEWTVFANSIEGRHSFGQIDFVQFLLMQQSTNVNSELGNLETFEYTRNARHGNNELTRNGVPMPMNTGRP